MGGGTLGRLRHPSPFASEEGTGRQVTGQLVTGGAGNSPGGWGARGSIRRAPAVPEFHRPVNPRQTTPPEDVRWEWHPVRREWIGITTETCLLCNQWFCWEGVLPIVCGPCHATGTIR